MQEEQKVVENTLTALEVTGTVDAQQILRLDEPLPIAGPKRVRVIVLYTADDAPSEAQWLYAAANNPAFAYLHDPAEDIYAATDGEPIRDDDEV